MNPRQNDKGRKWSIKIIQDRYGWLSLTPDQAELIIKYEREISTVHSLDFIPTMWEEKEIESYYFQQVLTKEQFKLYKKETKKQLRYAERQLVKLDKKAAKGIAYHKELLTFYKEEWVAKALKHKKDNCIGLLPNIKRRIEFLKDEYNDYLKTKLKELHVSHFRHARNFQPNQFKEELVRYEIHKVFPSFYFLEKESDKVIIETGKFLVDEMRLEFSLFTQFVDSIGETTKNKPETLFKKYYGERPSGFAIKLHGDKSEAEQNEESFLSYLLMDDEKYGWLLLK